MARASAIDDDAAGSCRPFLKWAGGKRTLISQILPHLPRRFGRYLEPFVGSGALFFHLQPARAALADNNERLIRTYCGLRDAPGRVIDLLSSYPHDRRFFASMRERAIDEGDDSEVAAWFIYLNKTAYNGLYRVNSKNLFNVPFGDYKRPNICDVRTLTRCAAALARADIEVADFEKVAKRARSGDLVYFDPPYVPLSTTSSFTAYTRHGFDLEQHRRLRDCALRLKQRGVHVVISNSAAPEVRELYAKSFRLVPIMARRSINCRADGRSAIAELLIV
jgi:DNA adenine methylase